MLGLHRFYARFRAKKTSGNGNIASEELVKGCKTSFWLRISGRVSKYCSAINPESRFLTDTSSALLTVVKLKGETEVLKKAANGDTGDWQLA